jgi:hypothetical protein
MKMAQTERDAGKQRPGSKPRPYKVVRVEKTLMPEGGGGQNWYRYVLDNGRSTITGQRNGSLKDVTAYANQYAEQLNARGIGGHSVWSPRAKKQA